MVVEGCSGSSNRNILGALGGQKTSATSNSIFNLDCSTSTLFQMMQLRFGHATSILPSESGDATSTSPNATSKSANATSTLPMQLRFWQCNFDSGNATSTTPLAVTRDDASRASVRLGKCLFHIYKIFITILTKFYI
jgi:hypothetical protein